ncbi:amino acid deaminase [Hydrogenophaga sp. 5NK40-0174]|uniref:amino acid deaminase n=1 Tax=Hydrogenophaga sp. 5NK40-0174 TaxID=3127649 RepID=UPI0031028FF2
MPNHPASFGPFLKGYPYAAPTLHRAALAGQGWNVLRGDLPLPLAVLREAPLRHNLDWMQQFCTDQGIELAPHGKTTMSPELWAMQLDAGAWGMTFATVFQASVGVRHGVRRIIIANQVVQSAELAALQAMRESHADLQICFLLDSLEQLRLIEAWMDRLVAPASVAPFDVLLEVGIEGQRTGCRTADQCRTLADHAHASGAVSIAGVECYEGVAAVGEHVHDKQVVGELMDRVDRLAHHLVNAGYMAHRQEFLVTAGGSAVFDLVARRLRPGLPMPVRGILRSGCYLTHDHQQYARFLCCMAEREGWSVQRGEGLVPALEVLAAVQSCPEPGLALVGMGKRDVSYDLSLPVPLWRAGPAAGASSGASETSPASLPSHWRVTGLNDQHGYLRYDPHSPQGEWPRVGEVVGFGISHPCTSFDKWRWMPVVDSQWDVVDGITTHF